MADSLPPRFEKLVQLMDDAAAGVFAFMTSPSEDHIEIRSTNPLECVNKEIRRRINVVGILPNEAAIVRLVGAILIEQDDEWAVAPRYIANVDDAGNRGPIGRCCRRHSAGNRCGVTERFNLDGLQNRY